MPRIEWGRVGSDGKAALADCTTDELLKELDRRNRSATILRNDALKQRHAQVAEFVEALLALIPEHDQSSCSDHSRGTGVYDSHLFDGDERPPRVICRRCALLHVQREKGNHSELVVDEITLRVEPLEKVPPEE